MALNTYGGPGGTRLTSGEPVATSLQTSLQGLTPLQIATGNFHLDILWRVENSSHESP